MIFVGDIAVPSEQYSEVLDMILEREAGVFKEKDLIINLEGLIRDGVDPSDNTPKLYNHRSAVGMLKNRGVKFAGLANNHTLDFPCQLERTTELLRENGIGYAGAGFSKAEADTPAEVVLDGKKAFIFNHCWSVMLQHQKNPSEGVFVSTIDEENVIRQVRKTRVENPEASIIVYFHWNFDLETLPFPLHRKLARALIDSGANIVAGCHSHCVQGGEAYGNGYIVYGLGNFFIPWKTFINGTIHFPDFARVEMAFEWNPQTNNAYCHFFRYENSNDKHDLVHLSSDPFEDSDMLKSYTPYMGMDEREYLSYFRENRRKRGGLPVYKTYETPGVNRAIDWIVKNRIRVARLLAKYRLREWNN